MDRNLGDIMERFVMRKKVGGDDKNTIFVCKIF